jgi:hypothetical protein
VIPIARNVEKVTVSGDDKRGRADPTAALRAYRARKRLISVRTSLFLAPLVAIAAVRNPVAGLQLALGGAIGVLNMLSVMRANERLLDGGRKPALQVVNAQVRIFAVGILPVAVAVRLGQFWTVGLYLAGFFTPLVLYAMEYHRSIKRGE